MAVAQIEPAYRSNADHPEQRHSPRSQFIRPPFASFGVYALLDDPTSRHSALAAFVGCWRTLIAKASLLQCRSGKIANHNLLFCDFAVMAA